jgi:hypothetical protein
MFVTPNKLTKRYTYLRKNAVVTSENRFMSYHLFPGNNIEYEFYDEDPLKSQNSNEVNEEGTLKLWEELDERIVFSEAYLLSDNLLTHNR